jgi:hypothetical protein
LSNVQAAAEYNYVIRVLPTCDGGMTGM